MRILKKKELKMKNFIKILITIFFITNINTQLFANETNAFSFKFPGSTGQEINMADYKVAILIILSCTRIVHNTIKMSLIYDEYKTYVL
jgi:hypothetical protein